MKKCLCYSALILFLYNIVNVLGLFEDQIGKLDWKLELVGNLKHSYMDINSPVKRLYISTEENVIAALHLRTGKLIWRQILDKGPRGVIHFLSYGTEVVTVSGQDNLMVRGWDSAAGFLHYEWMIPSFASSRLQKLGWFVQGGEIFCLTRNENYMYQIASFSLKSGILTSERKINSLPADQHSRCVLSAPFLVCGLKNRIVSVDLVTEEVAEHPLPEEFTTFKLEPLKGYVGVILQEGNRKHIYLLESSGITKVPYVLGAETDILCGPYEDKNILLHATQSRSVLQIHSIDLATGETIPDLNEVDPYPDHLGRPTFHIAMFSPRKDGGIGSRILISTDDHAIVLLHHPGKVAWIREEALAFITASEMLDLPVSDTEAAIENEFGRKDTNFVMMFVRRIVSQILQQSVFIKVLFGKGEAPSEDEKAGLVRDEFGLHKLIVAASPVKMFGIDSLTGEIIWQKRLENVEPFYDAVTERYKLMLFVQRTAKHYPYHAQCSILGKKKVTGEGILYVFNPFNGLPMDGENGVIDFNFRVKQAELLHQMNQDFLRGILFLDDKDQLHIYPESTRSVAVREAHSTYLFYAEPGTGLLKGYSMQFSNEQKLMATPTWEIKLSHGSQKIMTLVRKSSVERVHSQGRVLGDRSVLYKYINPNLVAIMAQGVDQVQRYFLNVYLIDVVSGAVVFSICHKRARGPVHMVHSENWVLYSYFSDKSRRTEIATLELYEGKVQSNPTAFSSVAAPLQPLVDRQAFILPSVIEEMKETITEKGITNKHILMALANGWILELPWFFVDPRRPITVTPEMREEGVIPYMPELPIPSEAVINYNQSVHRVKGIQTSPSGLESTCLVFVYGLDLFYTRVMPSKTFDVLKEDFDFFLIGSVVLGLIVASIVTKRLAYKKALKQSWK